MIPERTIFIMMNLAITLTMLNVALLVSFSHVVTKQQTACSVIALLLHFFLFSTLLWSTVEAVYVTIGVAKVGNVLGLLLEVGYFLNLLSKWVYSTYLTLLLLP